MSIHTTIHDGSKRAARRTYGTGSIIERHGVYHGQWRVGGKQVMRRLGRVRQTGSADGLTKTMAETRLREVMAEHGGAPLSERVSVAETGERLLAHLRSMGRKPSTMRSYESIFRTQIEPSLGERAIAKVTHEDIERFVADCVKDGMQPKTISNTLGLAHSIFEFAITRGWVRDNPCKRVERPRSTRTPTSTSSTRMRSRRSCVPCPTPTSAASSAPSTSRR